MVERAAIKIEKRLIGKEESSLAVEGVDEIGNGSESGLEEACVADGRGKIGCGCAVGGLGWRDVTSPESRELTSVLGAG